MTKVGERLKLLRQRRKLTTRRLSERSGVSHSTISLIERDKVSPSLDTMSAILDAMGSTVVAFLSDVGGQSQSPFYRAGELPEILNDDGLSYQIVGLNYPNRRMQLLQETYAVGADTGVTLIHEAEEAGIVIEGMVEVTTGTHKAVLGPGDGYYFDSRHGHRFRNVGDVPAKIISAVTPPTF